MGYVFAKIQDWWYVWWPEYMARAFCLKFLLVSSITTWQTRQGSTVFPWQRHGIGNQRTWLPMPWNSKTCWNSSDAWKEVQMAAAGTAILSKRAFCTTLMTINYCRASRVKLRCLYAWLYSSTFCMVGKTPCGSAARGSALNTSLWAPQDRVPWVSKTSRTPIASFPALFKLGPNFYLPALFTF